MAADRRNAVDALGHLSRTGNAIVRAEVIERLRALRDDDSRGVAAAAAAVLASHEPSTTPAETTAPSVPAAHPAPALERTWHETASSGAVVARAAVHPRAGSPARPGLVLAGVVSGVLVTVAFGATELVSVASYANQGFSPTYELASTAAILLRLGSMALTVLALFGYRPRRADDRLHHRRWFTVPATAAILIVLMGFALAIAAQLGAAPGLVLIVAAVELAALAASMLWLAFVGRAAALWPDSVAAVVAGLPVVWIAEAVLSGKLFGVPELVALSLIAWPALRATPPRT